MIFIPDQFEVEPNISYSGSFNSFIYTGTLNRLDTLNRSVVAKKTLGSDQIFIQNTFAGYQNYSASRRNKDLGIDFRFSQLISSNERYADTILTDFVQAYLLNGGKVVSAGIENNLIIDDLNSKLIFSSRPTVTASSAGTQIADYMWLKSFPFENRYRNIPKNATPRFFEYNNLVVSYDESKNLSTHIVNYGAISPETEPLFSIEIMTPPTTSVGTEPNRSTFINVKNGRVSANGIFHLSDNSVYPISSSASVHFSEGTGAPNITEIYKAMYGFGDGPQFTVFFPSIVPWTKHLDELSFGFNTFYPSYCEIRGFKYGVLNINPQFTKAIYRKGKYGQPRDMLEQRQYTQFYDTVGLNDDGTPNSRVGLLSPVVSTLFISGTAAYITSTNDNALNMLESGIYRVDARSTKPYIE